MPTIKITEAVRSAMLRRPLVPDVARSSEISGLCLHVTSRRSFWSLIYQPRGVNSATGKRWGGGVRHELGDAMLMTVSEAKAAALAMKALVRQGRDPHREAMAATAAQTAARAMAPKSASDALDAYTTALMSRRQPSEGTRKQILHYARKAVRLIGEPAGLALSAIDERAIRLMLETMPGSDGERRLVFIGLRRFLQWARKTGFVEHNPCDDLDRDERPRPGKTRDHTPTIATLRAVWNAVETEERSVRDLVRFLLLTPLRLNEGAGLRWGEVDLASGRMRIGADRMKSGQGHELPLSAPALAILEARQPTRLTGTDLVFPSSECTSITNWSRILTRIRFRVGEAGASRDQRFVFHDTRRSFVSALAELGFDVDALDQVLAHGRKGTFAVYQRASRMNERARALEAWAGLILSKGDETRDSNVVKLHASR